MTQRDFIDRQQVIRRDMMAALYDLHRHGKGGYLRQLTHALGHAPDECCFALDYLIGAGVIRRADAHFRLTANGIERFEREFQ